MADNKKYITRGAMIACEHGSKRILLNIPEGHGVYVGWQPIAHNEDCKPEENILSFGTCSSPDYHKSSKLNGWEKLISFGALNFGQECLLDLLPQWFICDETQYIMPCTQAVTPLSELSDDELKKAENANVFSEVTSAKKAFTVSSSSKEDILSADEVKQLEKLATTADMEQPGNTLLTMDSVLVCRCGGVIKFLTSGQEYVDEEMLKKFGTEISGALTAKTPDQLEKENKESEIMLEQSRQELVNEYYNASDARKQEILKELNIIDPPNPVISKSQMEILGSLYPQIIKGSEAGWQNINIEQLNDTLKYYGIVSPKSLEIFMAQCSAETGFGEKAAEMGSDSYLSYLIGNGGIKTIEEAKKWRGAGYIQMTYPDAYRMFAEDLKKRGLPYAGVTEIGCEYVAENYPWDASAFVWTGMSDGSGTCEEHVQEGLGFNEIINQLAHGSSKKGDNSPGNNYKDKKEIYDEIQGLFD